MTTPEREKQVPRLRIVTREQLQRGYIQLVNGRPEHRNYGLIREIDRGPQHEPVYEVINPELAKD